MRLSGWAPLDNRDLRLFYQPAGRLRLTTADRSYLSVKPAWAAPLSHPNRFLALLDGKGKEIAMFAELDELGQENRGIVEAELRHRYLNGVIHRVLSVKAELGVTYWHVITDRGERDFVTQSLHENAQWLGDQHLLIIDVDGNRYEVKDVPSLDERSRELIASAT